MNTTETIIRGVCHCTQARINGPETHRGSHKERIGNRTSRNTEHGHRSAASLTRLNYTDVVAAAADGHRRRWPGETRPQPSAVRRRRRREGGCRRGGGSDRCLYVAGQPISAASVTATVGRMSDGRAVTLEPWRLHGDQSDHRECVRVKYV